MQEDNVYPTNGAYFAPPREQEDEIEQERDQVLSSAPQIREVIDYLRECAKDLDSVSAIDQSVLTNPDEFMHVVAANQMAKEIITRKADALALKFKEYTE